MSNASMQTSFAPADQAVQVITFSPQRSAESLSPFQDNLDHLQALEQEGVLLLAVASMRRCQQYRSGSTDPWEAYRQHFPDLPPAATLEQVRAMLAERATA